MKRIRIEQIRSVIDRPERQKRTMRCLGLTRMHKVVEHEVTPQIVGMVNRVSHLVKVKNI